MSRSQETFGKKEVRSKQEKKRKEKEKRRLEKKEKGKQGLDSMIAYVDENGNIVDTPPDITQREEIDAESIELGIPKQTSQPEDKLRKGVIVKFDSSKGYGFIQDSQYRESIFLHVNDCLDRVSNGDKVAFETEKGPKGLKALNVRIVK